MFVVISFATYHFCLECLNKVINEMAEYFANDLTKMMVPSEDLEKRQLGQISQKH